MTTQPAPRGEVGWRLHSEFLASKSSLRSVTSHRSGRRRLRDVGAARVRQAATAQGSDRLVRHLQTFRCRSSTVSLPISPRVPPMRHQCASVVRSPELSPGSQTARGAADVQFPRLGSNPLDLYVCRRSTALEWLQRTLPAHPRQGHKGAEAMRKPFFSWVTTTIRATLRECSASKASTVPRPRQPWKPGRRPLRSSWTCWCR